MKKPQTIFEAIVVIAGIFLFVGWIWIAVIVNFGGNTEGRSTMECFTASGDAC